MVIEVMNVNWSPGKSKRAIVSLLDTEGDSLRLIDYEGAEISMDWKEGYRYRISRCKVQKGGGGYDLELAPSKRTRIEPLGPAEQCIRILVVGDTHVGRTKHPGTDEKIDPVNAFSMAVKYGITQEVDAVLHVGDIFHDSATSEQANQIDKRVFAPLQKAKIPFYYVRGNHGSDDGIDVLSKRRCVSNLDTNGVTVGPDVRVFGINHYKEGEVEWNKLTFPDRVSEPLSILVLHQTVRQLSGPKSKSVDLDRVRQRFGGQFDFVVSGHHHDAMHTDWDGVPVMYAGASEHMSTNADPVDRVAWLLTADNSSVTAERYDIP